MRRIKINENELYYLIKESVRKTLKENYEEEELQQEQFNKIDAIKQEIRSLFPTDDYDYNNKEIFDEIVNEICDKLDELINVIQLDVM